MSDPLWPPWTTAHQASLFITNSWSFLRFTFIESVMPSNHLILYCPLLLLPSIFPSNSIFSNESALCIRWPKDWSFSFSISPSNEYSGLISFRIDWFDTLAVQGTLKSLLQTTVQKNQFFDTQPSLWSNSHIHTWWIPYQNENHNHRKLNWLRGSQPCPTQWNYIVQGHPRQTGHGGEFWQYMVHWRREWQPTSVFLPGESHEQY